MTRRARVIRSMGILAALSATAPHAGAVPRFYQGPPGPPDNRFGDPQNWDPPTDFPHAQDDAFHNIGGVIVMDVPSGRTDPHGVASFVVGDVGSLDMGRFSGGDSSVIDFIHGMSSTAGINEYTLNRGSLDAVYVGDVTGIFGGRFEEDTSGFAWNLEGGSNWTYAVVTGTIGCGQWTASNAKIGAGYNVFGQLEDMGTAGVIDGAVCGSRPAPIDSIWTLDGVSVYAKVARNLDPWTV